MSQKFWYFVSPIAGAIIVLLVLVICGFDFKSKSWLQVEPIAGVNPVVVEDIDSVNIALGDSIVSLNEENGALEDSIVVLKDVIVKLNTALDKCSSSKKTAAKAKKPVTSSQEPLQKVVVEVVVKNPEIAEVVAEAPKKVVSQPTKAVVETPAIEEKVIACFRTNGSKDQYFPHYAIDRGATVSNAKDNRKLGYNYILNPVESISGSVPGITKEGVFFVPVSYLKKYLNMSGESLKYVDLLYEENWDGVRMTLQGEYYVYHSR